MRWDCFEPFSLILSFRDFINLGKNFTAIPNQTHTQYLLNSSHLVISPSLFTMRWHTWEMTQKWCHQQHPLTQLLKRWQSRRAARALQVTHTDRGCNLIFINKNIFIKNLIFYFNWIPFYFSLCSRRSPALIPVSVVSNCSRKMAGRLGGKIIQPLLFPMLSSQGIFHSTKGDPQESGGFYRLTDA